MEILKIYHISQKEVDGYDTYDSAIVIAKDIETAKTMHPNGISNITDSDIFYSGTWANNINNITAIEIGIANSEQTQRVICASFNAG